MRLAVGKFFEIEQNRGKHILQVKSELNNAKKEGVLFFSQDVSSLNETENINLYFYLTPGKDDDRDAFPIPKKDYVLPKDENARFKLFKQHYESYYFDSKMDYNLFLSFDSKPFLAKNFVWFSRHSDNA